MTVKNCQVLGGDHAYSCGEVSSVALCDEACRGAHEQVEALRQKLENIESSFDRPIDCAAIAELLKFAESEADEIEENFRRMVGKEYQKSEIMVQLNDVRNSLRAVTFRLDIEPFKTLAREQEKWVRAGFDRELLTSDPEAVRFAVRSRLIYTISMFAKSSSFLRGERCTIKNDGGRAHFKVHGEWVPYDALKEKIRFSEKECSFEGWNFIHPDGFVQKDSATYDEVYPVATLTAEGYKASLDHAQSFWSPDQPEIDPGVEKKYVLQVVTTGRQLLPRAWWSKNAIKNFPEHGSLRLITPDGDIYSFGTKMRLPDQEFLSTLSHYFGTGISNVPMPDYEEPRNSDDRTMAALPLSKERAEIVLDFVRRANKGIAFNFARQNCVRFTEVVLGLVGVSMSTKMRAGEALCSLLPSLSDVPVVGVGMAICAKKISTIASKICSFVGSVCARITPTPTNIVWSWMSGVYRGVAQRIEALFWSCMSLFVMGATLSIVPQDHPCGRDVPEVESFRQMMHWKEIFSPEPLSVYYSSRLKQWMMKQRSCVVFSKPEHGFCCFPGLKTGS